LLGVVSLFVVMAAMTHIAIQEKKDGNVVDWMEQVSDEQYSDS
jgi:hypothetical protein